MITSKSRALIVQRGSPPSVTSALLRQKEPAEGEILVQVRGAAFTPTDVELCSKPQPPFDRLLRAESFTPGFFFCGEVLSLGLFVEGLTCGEPVLGLLDGASLRAVEEGSGTSNEAADHGFGSDGGGCYRERFCVHYSQLVPAVGLVPNFHLPSVIAHVPPMIHALYCVSSHLRLRPGESLVILAPRFASAVFVLQRLLLLQDTWIGPLFLIVQHSRAPSAADLERHALLAPLLKSRPPGDQFLLENLYGYSVEEHWQQVKGGGGSVPLEDAAEITRELLDKIVDITAGAGVNVVLNLGIELLPPEAPQEVGPALVEDEAALSPLVGPLPKAPPTLLRALLASLALQGRLVTSGRRLELSPAESEHLWAKECSISFLNPHSMVLSAERHGSMLHAMVEVMGRIASEQLPVVEAEVAQYRLFEQFHHAFEDGAGTRGRSTTTGTQLMVLMV